MLALLDTYEKRHHHDTLASSQQEENIQKQIKDEKIKSDAGDTYAALRIKNLQNDLKVIRDSKGPSTKKYNADSANVKKIWKTILTIHRQIR